MAEAFALASTYFDHQIYTPQILCRRLWNGLAASHEVSVEGRVKRSFFAWLLAEWRLRGFLTPQAETMRTGSRG